jgi:adenylate kinase family enzyme
VLSRGERDAHSVRRVCERPGDAHLAFRFDSRIIRDDDDAPVAPPRDELPAQTRTPFADIRLSVAQRRPRDDGGVRRLSVVGNSGAGKSHLARRIAEVLDVPYVELDAMYHLAGWEPIEPGEFLARISEIAATDAWVIDGNYRVGVVEGPVWERADTVVWLDLPRRTVMRQVIARTTRRIARREALWNGNRERFRSVLTLDPRESIVLWAFTQHTKYAERYAGAMTSARYTHLHFVRLRTRAEIDEWVDRLAAEQR